MKKIISLMILFAPLISFAELPDAQSEARSLDVEECTSGKCYNMSKRDQVVPVPQDDQRSVNRANAIANCGVDGKCTQESTLGEVEATN